MVKNSASTNELSQNSSEHVCESWQIIERRGALVGGIHPNNILYVKGKSDEETIALLKECIDEKYGEKSE